MKILVFGDVGIDDTLALIYAHFSEDIEIVGVVADYGNISREHAIANVHYISEVFNISEKIKIFAGAELPMTGEAPAYFPEIHGEYGLGPIIPSTNFTNGVVSENFFKIIDIIKAYDNELVIVNIGRLTSLATMFILYNDLMSKIKEYYIMGGAFWFPGNVTAVSEANFYGDPIAVDIVLTYAENVTIIPLNVTEQAIVTPEMVDYIDSMGRVKIVKPMLDYYYNFYKKRNPSVEGSPMHDVLTLMAIIHEDMFSFQMLPVEVVKAEEGIERGQSIADIRPYVTLEKENKRKFRIAFDLDYTKFYIDFMSKMTGQQFV